MKKNLRIVSAAAAALLAVAPVAATAMPVNTAANTTISLPSATPDTKGDITLSSNVKAVTYPERTEINNNTGVAYDYMWNGKLSGNVTATYNGKQYTVTLPSNATVAGVFEKDGNLLRPFKAMKDGRYSLRPGKVYYARVNGASINLGTENANLSDKKLGSNAGDVLFQPKSAARTELTFKGGKLPKSVRVNKDNKVKGIVPAKDMSDAEAAKYVKGAVGAKTNSVIPNRTPLTIVKADANDSNAVVSYTQKDGNKNEVKKVAYVSFKDLNFEKKVVNASKIYFGSETLTVNTNQNGGVYYGDSANLGDTFDMLVRFIPTDTTNSEGVNFFEKATNTRVTTGTLNLAANPSTHELNVQDVLNAAKAKYSARQDGDKTNSVAYIDTDVKDLTDQLTKAGIKVDALGNFEAPASFSFNLHTQSDANKAANGLPITVSVTNGVQTPAAQETTKNVTIMHISTIYDKNGKATHEPALRAYNTVSVVSDPVTLKDETGKDAGKFYKLAGKDQYIKVGNVDGTSRTLKHNSYVYKSTGKRANKKTLKKGSSVTTYGKSFMIAGHQMYRIGKNQYVKKANF